MLVSPRLESISKETFQVNPRNFDYELKWQMNIHFQFDSLHYQTVNKIYYLNFIINENCKSPQYCKDILLKLSLMISPAVVKEILPNSPLIKDFVKPLLTVLIKWRQSEEVCNACRQTIKAEQKFTESLMILSGMAWIASNEITIPEQELKKLKNALQSAVQLITKNAYCLNKIVFEVPSEQE